MAIYKPSNCRPFLGAIDLTQKQYFECEVNTSNTLVTGYKIRILDSLNTVIFNSDRYSIVQNTGTGNSGLNGSVLSVPIIVLSLSELTYNNIYYSTTDKKWYRKTDGEAGRVEIANFNNSYTNQPYKWQISLAQGIGEEGDIKPQGTRDVWYDMRVAAGQAMGSVPDRIQGPVSDKIYKDYYIQLCKNRYEENTTAEEQGRAFVGSGIRRRILRYDNSFGYIYPEEGKYTQQDIDEAKYFQVFKYGNDKTEMQANRIVDYATTKPLTTMDITVYGVYAGFPNGFEKRTGSGEYYEQVYNYESDNPHIGVIPFHVSLFDSYFVGKSRWAVAGETKVLVKNEGDPNPTDEYPAYASPKNGVFTFVSAIVTHPFPEAEPNARTLTILWQRSEDARNIASFIDRAFHVLDGSSAGLNYENNAKTGGVLDSSLLAFTKEEPVEIYYDESLSDWRDKNFGRVHKNSREKTYVRPFTGIGEQMLFKYTDTVDSETIEKSLDILEVDTKGWGITHTQLPKPIEPKTPYTINSFYKNSDYNPFYSYSTPTVSIIGEEGSWEPQADGTYESKGRFINLRGEYFQAQNKSWKSFYWVLRNLTFSQKTTTEVSYSGKMEVRFEGLQSNNLYEVSLVVEDEMGMVVVDSCLFKTVIKTLPSTGQELEIDFDCETQSVKLNFAKNGKVSPDENSTDGLSLEDGVLLISDAGEGNSIAERGYGIRYDSIKTLRSNGDVLSERIGVPQGESFTINSEHILNPYFEGGIFEAVVYGEKTEALIGQYRLVLQVSLPPEVETIDGWTDVNPQRNQILLTYWREVSRGLQGDVEVWDSIPLSRHTIALPCIVDGVAKETWRLSLDSQDSKISYGLLPIDFDLIAGRDYLITDEIYDIVDSSGSPLSSEEYGHLSGLGLNVSNGEMRFPTEEAEPITSEGVPSVWTDGQIAKGHIKSSLEASINLEKLQSLNYWTDHAPMLDSYGEFLLDSNGEPIEDSSGTVLYWNDISALGVYEVMIDIDGEEMLDIDGEEMLGFNDISALGVGEGSPYIPTDANQFNEGILYEVMIDIDGEEMLDIDGEEMLGFADATSALINHSGRQEIENLKLTFNIVVSNLDLSAISSSTSPVQTLEIEGYCFIENI